MAENTAASSALDPLMSVSCDSRSDRRTASVAAAICSRRPELRTCLMRDPLSSGQPLPLKRLDSAPLHDPPSGERTDPAKTKKRKNGVTYLMMYLYTRGTFISAPVLISCHPLSMPKIQAKSMDSARANI